MEIQTIALYMAAVVLLTHILLKYVFKNTGETERLITSAIVGIGLGAIWSLWCEAQLDQLIVSYLASVGFYHIILKRVMGYFGKTYNDGKGLLK